MASFIAQSIAASTKGNQFPVLAAWLFLNFHISETNHFVEICKVYIK